MPKDVPKFTRLSSVFSVVLAVLVGVLIGSVVAFAAITVVWGLPDLWPLGVG